MVRDFHRVIIQHPEVFHTQEVGCIRGRCFRIDADSVRVFHIFCGKRLPVMPFDIFAQMEADGRFILGDLPGFSEITHEPEILIIFEETVVNHPCNVQTWRIGRKDREQHRSVANTSFEQHIAVSIVGRGFAVRRAGFSPWGIRQQVIRGCCEPEKAYD